MSKSRGESSENLDVVSPLKTRFLARLITVNFAALVLAIVVSLACLHQIGLAYTRLQAEHLMDSMLAVREYTSRKINPLIAPVNAESPDVFLPEAVPSYSSTKVFEYLRLKDDYKGYSYREAALNPTNPVDRASEAEAQVIRRFIKNPESTRSAGYLDKGGMKNIFYVAQPIKITKQSCLACHSVPERAPRSQVASYGDQNGFGWEMGDIVGAQIVAIELSAHPLAVAWQSSMLLLLQIFLLIVATVASYWLFRNLIVQPLARLGGFLESERCLDGAVVPPGAERDDEIGLLARGIDYLRRRGFRKYY